MDIFQIAAQFRKRLIALDQAATDKVLAAYQAAMGRLLADVQKVLDRINTVPDAGLTIGAFYQFGRLRELQAQLGEEIQKLGGKADQLAVKEQQQALILAERQAQLVINQIGLDFKRLPKGALNEFLGLAADGSELKASFERLALDIGKNGGETLERAIIQGIALGYNPEKIVAQLRKELDAQNNPYKNPEIVRRLRLAAHTGVMAAYRESTRQIYEENEITHWRWSAAKDSRCCPVCWGLDGKLFDIGTPQAAHPGCRCTMLPVLDENESPPTNGEEDFLLKPPEYQRQTLGKAGFEAYQSGDLLFTSDLVGYRQTPYGNQPFQRSLKSVLGDDLAKFYRDGNTKRPDLAELESKINQLEREVVLYLKDDRIAFRALGNADSVYWSPKQRADAPNGGILTHNHPRLPGAPDGGTFSLSDLLVATEKQVQEIRIVTSDGLGRQIGYSVRAESWPSPKVLAVKYELAVSMVARSMGIKHAETWLESQSMAVKLDFYDKVLRQLAETETNRGRPMTYERI